MTSNSITGIEQAGIGLGKIDGDASLAYKFALLQLSLANTSKASASDRIQAMSAQNNKLKQAREYLSKMRSLYSNNASKKGTDTFEDTAGAWKFFLANNISYAGKSSDGKAVNASLSASARVTPSKDNWDANIKSLESFIDAQGTDTQLQMVQIQDDMGKYQNWTQGASRTIQDDKQTLQAIIRS